MVWGCDAQEQPSAEPPAAEAEATASELNEELREQLAQLGYSEFSADVAGAESGVVLHDAQQSSPGYSLYTVVPRSLSVLIDSDGQEINSWPIDGAFWTTRCELLSNGDVLIIGTDRDGDDLSGYLQRMSWEGEVLWRREVMAHHDVELTPDGNVLTITSEDRWLPDLDPKRPCQDNVLSLFTAEGEDLGTLSLHDLVATDPKALPLIQPTKGIKRDFQDFFHANSAVWMPMEDLVGSHTLYNRDHVLVTLRHQNMIMVVDWVQQRIVWTWGRGELVLPHEATWLANGNLLVFDNGDVNRPWSRIVEMDPRVGEIVWEYKASVPGSFYSPGRGTAQRLPNDSILVSYSSEGEAFEVTREGRVVWRFLSPYLSRSGNRLAVRMKRYSLDMVDAILQRHGPSQR